MSIALRIQQHYTSGQLIRHDGGAIQKRVAYISGFRLDGQPSLAEMLDLAVPMDDRSLERWGYARQWLDTFVRAQAITVPPDSRKAGKAFMSRLEPDTDEVWDIRVYDPKPGLRLVGRVAERDVFVALAWDYRENLDGEGDWNRIKHQCLRSWRILFGDLQPPDLGSYPDGYITGAVSSTDRS